MVTLALRSKKEPITQGAVEGHSRQMNYHVKVGEAEEAVQEKVQN